MKKDMQKLRPLLLHFLELQVLQYFRAKFQASSTSLADFLVGTIILSLM